MKIKMINNGSILIVVVFVIALMTALVAGLLQLNTEQILIMKNEYFAAQASEIANAGLADALSRIKRDQSLPSNFNNDFGGGSYSVQIVGSLPDPNIISTGISQQGFVSKVKADVTVDTAGSYVVRIDKLRINE